MKNSKKSENWEESYQKIYKWGDPDKDVLLEDKFKQLIKQRIPTAFEKLPDFEPGEELQINKPTLDQTLLKKLEAIVGSDNISQTDLTRLKHSYGGSYLDVLKYRLNQVSYLPDVIVYPRSEEDIVAVIQLCNEHSIPIVPTGGLTSVTEGFEFTSGGIALNLTKHLKDVIQFNQDNSSIIVQAGIFGPKLEEYLNGLQDETGLCYTCGHFPQSFEYSTVGGWVATRSAGQESTGYGKIEDMVLGLRIVTPSGILEVDEYPARATGPDIKQAIIGSEGAFGVITQVTLKVWKYNPKATQYFAFLFKDWPSALKAVRSTMQSRIGKPSVFRLSDPEETDYYIEMAELAPWKDKLINFLGYESEQRTLLMGTVSGEKGHAKYVAKRIKRNLKKLGGFSIGKSPVRYWLEDRFDTPYLRDPLIENGIMIDTLETACTWENIEHVWKGGTTTIKNRPDTISMCHASHIYENGANLYFVIMSKADESDQVEHYLAYQQSIIKAIIASGGSLSHHHGIGRLYAPWLEDTLGTVGFNLLKALKRELDPEGIMNPGVLKL